MLSFSKGKSAQVRNTMGSKKYSKPSLQDPQHSIPGSMLGFGVGQHQNQTYTNAPLASRPPFAVCQKLCQAYIDRVHPPVKALHLPTLLPFLRHGGTYLDYDEMDPVLDLLRAAVFFLTVVTLSEEQCKSDFDMEKSTLVSNYRLACEMAMDRVGLVATEDITILQSFVLYLVKTPVASFCHPSTTILIQYSDSPSICRSQPCRLDSICNSSPPCNSHVHKCG